MRVYFSALAEFTENISVKFWRKLRADLAPFISLQGTGGPKRAQFQGVMELEDASDELLNYQITEALVRKVESLSRVGVERIDFEEMTRGAGRTLPIVGYMTADELQKKSRKELIEMLHTQFDYPLGSSKRMSKKMLVESILCSQRNANTHTVIARLASKPRYASKPLPDAVIDRLLADNDE